MEFVINGLEEIDCVAKDFVNKFGNKKVFAMYGPMGVGKTTFVKSVCKVLGIVDVANSPSFAIVNEYHGEKRVVYHFDFYRINSIEEAYDFGYEEYFYSENMCFIEWPEKIEPLLPEDSVILNFRELDDGKRIIEVS